MTLLRTTFTVITCESVYKCIKVEDANSPKFSKGK